MAEKALAEKYTLAQMIQLAVQREIRKSNTQSIYKNTRTRSTKVFSEPEPYNPGKRGLVLKVQSHIMY